MHAATLLATLTELVLPRCCAYCGSPAAGLCERCLDSLEPVRVELPGRTGGSAESAYTAFAAGEYDGAVRAAIVAYKERGRRDLARTLARLLAGSAQRALLASPAAPGSSAPARAVLVAVPSARAAARARGGQHMSRLANLVAEELGLPVAEGALSLGRVTRDSAGLGIDEREANLAGAMTAARPPPGTPGAMSAGGVAALVLDDVVTTGATLSESVRALRAAGWPVLGAAVLAATARRFPRPASRS